MIDLVNKCQYLKQDCHKIYRLIFNHVSKKYKFAENYESSFKQVKNICYVIFACKSFSPSSAVNQETKEEITLGDALEVAKQFI